MNPERSFLRGLLLLTGLFGIPGGALPAPTGNASAGEPLQPYVVPEGSRVAFIQSDTLRVGTVAGGPLQEADVLCLAYRPALSRQQAFSRWFFQNALPGLGWLGLGWLTLQSIEELHQETGDFPLGFLGIILLPLEIGYRGAALVDFLFGVASLSRLPSRRGEPVLWIRARDEVIRQRCAEILQFALPLLDRDTTVVLPLR